MASTRIEIQDLPGLRETAVPDYRICQNCGRIGREGIDVSTAHHWVGGIGHELRTYCIEMVLCFTRRERQEQGRNVAEQSEEPSS